MTAAMIRRLLLAALLLTAPAPANAAASDWFQAEGASLQIVTAETPEADGRLRGVLRIMLEPGWKTYWKDPGDAGIAPEIDVSASMNVTGVELLFPPPARFSEGESVSTGYVGSVDLPFLLSVGDASKFIAVDADVLLGVCREICVPLKARLSAMPGGGSEAPDPVIAAAFARLPPPPSADFGLTRIRDEGATLVADAVLPAANGDVDLFVVSPKGWTLGQPRREAGSAARFRIPVAVRAGAASAAPIRLEYALVTSSGAVHGALDLP
jgi:DsbC/DsbD-like thiol-disulfide interchange protein